MLTKIKYSVKFADKVCKVMKYINILAGIRFWLITVFVAIISTCFIVYIISIIGREISYNRKTKLLKSYGCERYLRDVSSVGDGAFYGWKTNDYKINIQEHELKTIKYKNLKKLLKDTVKNQNEKE